MAPSRVEQIVGRSNLRRSGEKADDMAMRELIAEHQTLVVLPIPRRPHGCLQRVNAIHRITNDFGIFNFLSKALSAPFEIGARLPQECHDRMGGLNRMGSNTPHVSRIFGTLY
jgi:hypothetical protein